MEKNKYFLIFGLGKTGISLIEFCIKNNLAFKVWDDNNNHLKTVINQNIVAWDPKNKEDYKNIAKIYLSPAININKVDYFNNDLKKLVTNDIELFYSKVKNFSKIISITGTNGKSTTTDLIYTIMKDKFKVKMGGNIGIAVMNLLDNKTQDDYYVLELSSFQLDLIQEFQPYISVLTNITTDHLDYHGTMDNYINAKLKLFKNNNPESTAIINIDSDITKIIFNKLKKTYKGTLVACSIKDKLEHGVSIIDNICYYNVNNKQEIFQLPDIQYIKGDHNLSNIASVIAVLGEIINIKDIISIISSYRGLTHRQQYIGKKANISFINDSKATNIKSTYYALKTYDRVLLLAGGISKDFGFSEIADILKKSIIKIFLFGKDKIKLSQFCKENNILYSIHEDLEESLLEAYHYATLKPEENFNILLSPACASLDQWKNYEERGYKFIELVDKIISQ